MKATAKTTTAIEAPDSGSQFQVFAQSPVSPAEANPVRPIEASSFIAVTRRLRKSGSFLGVTSLTIGIVGLINVFVAMFFGWQLSADFLRVIGPVGIALHAAGMLVGLWGCYRDNEGFWGLLGMFCNGMVLASALLLYLGAG
ncbi:MAG: hypothetical protein JO308_13835 [Verrucomicrobia bacterium]|nr:hypothetical protein [Verrucomicrobiota bacterium]